MSKKTILYLVGFVLVVVFLYSIKDMRTTHSYLEFAVAGTIMGFAIKLAWISFQKWKNPDLISDAEETEYEITTEH